MKFFVINGVKQGRARSFVNDIETWVKDVLISQLELSSVHFLFGNKCLQRFWRLLNIESGVAEVAFGTV